MSSKLLLTGLLCLPLLSTAVLADSHKSEKPCRYPVNENLGWEFYRANEFSQALTVFQNTLSITPKDISALRGQAYSLYKLKQYNLALLKLPEVIALEASHKLPVFKDITQYGQKVHYNAQTLLAWCHYALGKPALAKTLFNQTLDLHPHWADAYTGLGYTAISLNRRSAAESSFKRALQATPHYQPAERGLREAKRLHYGLHFALHTSYGHDGLDSPYQSSVNQTFRLGYQTYHNKVALQATHANNDTNAVGQNTSSDRSTLSWTHLADDGIAKRLGFRVDLAHISHSQQLYDKTVVPYFALLYFNRNHGQYYDLGMSKAHYREDGFGTDVAIEQYSATAGRSFGSRKYWAAIRLMGQTLRHPESSSLTEHLFSGSAMLKWRAIPNKLDVTGFLMGGERRYAYSPHSLNVTTRWERQTQSLGLSAGWHCCKDGLITAMVHQDRYNPNGSEDYHVQWVSLGLKYRV